MNINIRNAIQTDAEKAVPLIIEAIGDIAKRLTGEEDWKHVELELIKLFHRNDNRHSYRFTYVAELGGEVAGIMVLYPGDIAEELDANLVAHLKQKGSAVTEIDQEALRGEIYIDTMCTERKFRGQGIGSALLRHAETVAKNDGYGKLSLNVELEKEAAIRLYRRLGYEVSLPWTIIGEPFYHMVKEC